MLIFNHKDIESKDFIIVNSIEDIDKTLNISIPLIKEFDTNIELVKYCKKCNIEYAIEAKSIKDAIFANVLNCSFIVAKLELAKILQTIATEYLFDSKILTPVNSDKELEEVALSFIDGVIYNFNTKDYNDN